MDAPRTRSPLPPAPPPQPIESEELHRHLGSRALLDVRSDPEFERGHLEGSGHVRLAEFESRRAELPPREAPVLVLGDSAESARDAALGLTRLGFRDVRWLAAPISTLANHALVRGPAATLWRPNPFLAEVAPLLGRRGRVLDLASGSGRDAVYLALQGFAEVEAWDFDTLALQRAQALAARHGVRLRTLRCDLEAPDPPLVERAWDLIVCFRFLHRPLFERIANALVPGGHLVYETYRQGQERFGKPQRRRFLLAQGELARAFGALEILRYEEPSPESGPWTARLLARRRS